MHSAYRVVVSGAPNSAIAPGGPLHCHCSVSLPAMPGAVTFSSAGAGGAWQSGRGAGSHCAAATVPIPLTALDAPSPPVNVTVLENVPPDVGLNRTVTTC